jgi:hypothetical protein
MAKKFVVEGKDAGGNQVWAVDNRLGEVRWCPRRRNATEYSEYMAQLIFKNYPCARRVHNVYSMVGT